MLNDYLLGRNPPGQATTGPNGSGGNLLGETPLEKRGAQGLHDRWTSDFTVLSTTFNPSQIAKAMSKFASSEIRWTTNRRKTTAKCRHL